MTAQIERALQEEILLRIKRYPLVQASIPNGLWIPTHSEEERRIVARIISRMKSDGMLTPGAGDMILAGAKGAEFVECKRPETRDLLGTRRPKGQLSADQKAFRAQCERNGVRYITAYSWDDIEPTLADLY